MADNTHKGHRERLRERIKMGGFESLFPHEVLEYILFGCIKRGDTNNTAHQLIAAFGSLKGVFEGSVDELMAVSGIGESAAIYLKSYAFIAGLKNEPQKSLGERLASVGKIKKYLINFFLTKSKEEFHVLLLNAEGVLLSHISMLSPITNKVYVDMHEVFVAISAIKPAVIVFAHNHPSGSAYPSDQDINFTRRYFSALSLAFNLSICEHLIFTKEGECYSFRHSGLLNKIRKEIEIENGIEIAEPIDLGGLDE